MKFWRWLGVETSTYDHAYIKVSNDGAIWTTVWENTEEVADSDWNLIEIDISEIADNQSSVYVKWTMGETDGGWQYCGWNIDDVKILGYESNGIDDNYELSIMNYQLKQNYPNPFNPITKICYELSVSSNQLTEIVVYNAMGQMVWSSQLTAHSSQLTGSILFDGSKFNSGVYYYSLVIDGKRMSSKAMILIK